MNKSFLIGRATADPEVRYGQENLAIARFTMAIDRRKKDDGADFIRMVAFGKTAELIEKYVRKGMLIAIAGRIQTGSYENKNGDRVYTTEVVAEEIQFCEKKDTSSAPKAQEKTESNSFMDIPDGFDEELPFT